MTRAFLELLTSLTDTPVPVALGAGHRTPGFEPYLQFIMDGVFLKFANRAYKDPAEKVSSKSMFKPPLYMCLHLILSYNMLNVHYQLFVNTEFIIRNITLSTLSF